MTPGLSRRRALQQLAWPALAIWAGPGCTQPSASPLRIGTNPWLGYELMHLARHRQYFHGDAVRLVEMPNASASLRALAAGTLEGAGLTLDEVLSARARGLPLRVVAVVDVSHGADMLIAAPGTASLAALSGRRIGVEQSATGALMLDAALTRAGLAAADVRLVPLAVSEHLKAMADSRVDAVVSFEPVCSALLAQGAHRLFTSAEAPGLIVDVLAVRAEVPDTHGPALRALVAGLFRARADWLAAPAAMAPMLAPRLHLPPAEVVRAFGGVQLPDLAANRDWLGGPAPALMATARRVAAVMQRAGLLPTDADPLATVAGHALADPRCLPSTP
jgi:NitT/TauT family transport system substrate-binding protein